PRRLPPSAPDQFGIASRLPPTLDIGCSRAAEAQTIVGRDWQVHEGWIVIVLGRSTARSTAGPR
ncbi:MAG: hypothetical protein OXJ64_20770, partial [Boseongicola sp.]|nr:hypothetical protein [Boseongicola sp.]